MPVILRLSPKNQLFYNSLKAGLCFILSEMKPEQAGIPEIIVSPEDLATADKLLELMDYDDFADLDMGMHGYTGNVREGVGYCFKEFEIDPKNIDLAKVAELKNWTTALLQKAGHLPAPA